MNCKNSGVLPQKISCSHAKLKEKNRYRISKSVFEKYRLFWELLWIFACHCGALENSVHFFVIYSKNPPPSSKFFTQGVLIPGRVKDIVRNCAR